jgi:hypothetical protein
MARETSKVCVKSSIRHRPINRNEVKSVMRALEEVIQNNADTRDPIVEKLKQCPEAFKVGEILGKALDALKCGHNEASHTERYLPPSGAVIPPLV